MPYHVTETRREQYRQVSNASRVAKQQALAGLGPTPIHAVNTPAFDPHALMPQLYPNGLRALSIFSGGGGLDIGFEKAGFTHVASHDILPICAQTISTNRPTWSVFGGSSGDVTQIDWTPYTNRVEVLHGGPPCQPFSVAGHQSGEHDPRDMWPEFVRAVQTIKPPAFVGENVLGLLDPKFRPYITRSILEPLQDYRILTLSLNAADFGVPQTRQRVFLVGFRSLDAARRFKAPSATHRHSSKRHRSTPCIQLSLLDSQDEVIMPTTMGVRKALGLPDIGFDDLAPTLRSGFTGPRNSTSIVNSVASLRTWDRLAIWPHGVAPSRDAASMYVTKNGGFRLSVQDCALLQGFPDDWTIVGPVYKSLGQIGNSVAPPVAYMVASAVAGALLNH
jgi:DNA (cytosine-5)-methyltransferase 1